MKVYQASFWEVAGPPWTSDLRLRHGDQDPSRSVHRNRDSISLVVHCVCPRRVEYNSDPAIFFGSLRCLDIVWGSEFPSCLREGVIGTLTCNLNTEGMECLGVKNDSLAGFGRNCGFGRFRTGFDTSRSKLRPTHIHLDVLNGVRSCTHGLPSLCELLW